MEKGISTNNYNDMLRKIIAEVKMTRIVIANRLSASVTQLYWNIGRCLSIENNIPPHAVAVLPWGHNHLILSKIKDRQEALYYAEIEVALRDFHKPIDVAEYKMIFPENEIKSLINRELNQ